MKDSALQAYVNTVLDYLNDAVAAVDRDGIVIYWNKIAEDMYGIPRNNIIGSKIGDFFQRESLMLFQVMETGVSVHRIYHNPRPDKHVFITAVPVHDEHARLIGAVSIEQDITHVVKLSEGRHSEAHMVKEKQSAETVAQRSPAIQTAADFVVESSSRGRLYPFLLVGEPGAGKEILAKFIHLRSRQHTPFLSVLCDSLPDGLLDSELFGYEGQAFDRPSAIRIGKLELAQEGTVYLQNVDALPLPTQAKLARALLERQFHRVGGTESVPLRCHVIGSSVLDVNDLPSESSISKELYYAFHAVVVPPLRKRREELPGLSQLFLATAATDRGVPAPRLSSEVVVAIGSYNWPGNIPELRNAMEHVVMVVKGVEVTLSDLPPTLRPLTLDELTHQALPLSSVSKELEQQKIEDALKRTGSNKTDAARLLGISRGALYYKMKQYGIRE